MTYDRRKVAGRLRLGPGKLDTTNTPKFQRANPKRLRKRNSTGALSDAVESAAAYAISWGETMHVYQGNSYGHIQWRVSNKASEYLDPINNTGAKVLSVTPDREIYIHDVVRGG